MEYEVGSAGELPTTSVTTGDTPAEEVSPIPDMYRTDAIELLCSLNERQQYTTLRVMIEHTARWLMARDKRWTEK